jgi:hypothetical protein
LRHALLVARRNLLQVRGNPQLLIFLVIQPVLFVQLFVYVFGGAIAGSSRQYVQFVIPGIIVQTVVFATAVTGIGLNEDLAKGIIDRFRSLPIARSAVLAGRILADTVRLTATVVVNLTERRRRRPARAAARRSGPDAGPQDRRLDRRPHGGVCAPGHPPVPPTGLIPPHTFRESGRCP